MSVGGVEPKFNVYLNCRTTIPVSKYVADCNIYYPLLS